MTTTTTTTTTKFCKDRDGVDAIVVLGCTINNDETLSPLAAERVAEGIALYNRGVAPLLVFSGGHTLGAGQVFTEAEAMRIEAMKAGVPSSFIRLEDRSTSTVENARMTALLLGKKKIVLVTQPYHMPRASFWFRRYGFRVTPHHFDSVVQDHSPLHGWYWMVRDLAGLIYTWAQSCLAGSP